MSDKSAIEWTDATWNPTRGCVKISPGCKHCYAKVFAERFRGVPGHPYEQGFDPRLVPEKLDEPLRWRRPRRIFVDSMSDLFADFVPSTYIAAVLGVTVAAPEHTYQVLTKRAERLPELFAWLPNGRHGIGASEACLVEAARLLGWTMAIRTARDWHRLHPEAAAFPNVWLGVSVEDREFGLPRIEHLRAVPAAVRFLSIEPLLEDLGELDLTGIHWVIAGGESGPSARVMHPEWVRSIRDQCAAANVPFFFKQWGGVLKKRHGRELDGRTHDAFPERRAA